ncbi:MULTISPECIES: hypothetical protein [Microbacterium]|uniref:hypothetical protein n=1 Tax=Microbacterium TaxID=33882 RepID=UPI00217DFEBD|nr:MULTISPECIES: hypothetical protein [Microbacterium]UWF77791.1 hypothetical protein JSY13_01595 [Microbacterium neungamense]WCM55968.1 hypothetical protein JRG78_01630 [Microbacterium sp. EF45047]
MSTLFASFRRASGAPARASAGATPASADATRAAAGAGRRRGPRHLLAGLVGLVLSAALAGCGLSIPTDPDGTLDRVRGGELRVGASPEKGLLEIDDGTPTGSLAELVTGFAESIDAEVEWTPGSEETLVGMLEHGELDLVVGAFTDQTPYRIDHCDDSVAQGAHAAKTLLHDLGLEDDPGIYLPSSPFSARVHGHTLVGAGYPALGSSTQIVSADPLLTAHYLGDTLVALTGIDATGLVRDWIPRLHRRAPTRP